MFKRPIDALTLQTVATAKLKIQCKTILLKRRCMQLQIQAFFLKLLIFNFSRWNLQLLRRDAIEVLLYNYINSGSTIKNSGRSKTPGFLVPQRLTRHNDGNWDETIVLQEQHQI
jgi:hypothetical protein